MKKQLILEVEECETLFAWKFQACRESESTWLFKFVWFTHNL